MVGFGGTSDPRSSRYDVDQQRFIGHARVKAPQAFQLPLLSLGAFGAQAVWSMGMAFAPPYLLDLGLSKSSMAAVFVAGPLSGLIVQPAIGSLADSNTSKYGRRRPFLAVSAVFCATAVLILGFAREIAGIFVSEGSTAHSNLAIAIAVVSVYMVDFSVNAVTALNRALMVDVASLEDQAPANAWAARLSGLGAVLSFLIGNLDLPAIIPSIFGKTQMQIIAILTCIILLVTHAIVLKIVEERVLVPSQHAGPSRLSPLRMLSDLLRHARRLPPPIIEIFKIQFFSFIGWFPVMFYSTVWVGELFKNSHPAVTGSLLQKDDIFKEATRVGSRAMLWHSVFALITSIILPILVPNPTGEAENVAISWLVRRLRKARTHTPDLPFWWVFSQFVFCLCMMATWIAGLTRSVFFATLVITITGFCWAITSWVPLSLLGILIQAQSAEEAHLMRQRDPDPAAASLLHDRDEMRTSMDRHPSSQEGEGGSKEHASRSDTESEADIEQVLAFGPVSVDDSADSTPGHTGTVLGLHNIAVVVPQFVVTVMSSIIFAIMEPDSADKHKSNGLGKAVAAEVGGGNSDALEVIFGIGGVSAFIAGVLGIRLVRKFGRQLRG